MFPVMFAIPRTSGWVAQWLELVVDKEQKIARAAPDLHRRPHARLRADGPALASARPVRDSTHSGKRDFALTFRTCSPASQMDPALHPPDPLG
jgi:hypothetical protein